MQGLKTDKREWARLQVPFITHTHTHTHTLDTSPCQLGAKPFFTLNPKLAHTSLMGACLVLLKLKNCLIRIAAHSVVRSTVSSSYCVNRQEACCLFFRYLFFFLMGLNFILGITDKMLSNEPPQAKGRRKVKLSAWV